jgi:hypothetical protein
VLYQSSYVAATAQPWRWRIASGFAGAAHGSRNGAHGSSSRRGAAMFELSASSAVCRRHTSSPPWCAAIDESVSQVVDERAGRRSGARGGCRAWTPTSRVYYKSRLSVPGEPPTGGSNGSRSTRPDVRPGKEADAPGRHESSSRGSRSRRKSSGLPRADLDRFAPAWEG